MKRVRSGTEGVGEGAGGGDGSGGGGSGGVGGRETSSLAPTPSLSAPALSPTPPHTLSSHPSPSPPTSTSLSPSSLPSQRLPSPETLTSSHPSIIPSPSPSPSLTPAPALDFSKMAPFKVPYAPYPEADRSVADRIARLRRKVDDHAALQWERFYRRVNGNFFKDRNWLTTEYPELLPYSDTNPGCPGVGGRTALKIAEFGCGVGNTIVPLLPLCPDAVFYGSDFSPHAIKVLRDHPQFSVDRVKAFICDIASEDPVAIGDVEMDAVLLIFVLSAIAPDRHANVLRRIAKVMRKGALLFFRDYGVGDLAEKRFLKKGERGEEFGQTLATNWHVRQDNTQAYFFSIELLSRLFVEAGCKVVQCKMMEVEIVNQKLGVKMFRRWIQGKFEKL
eukprot:TRINITY_DN4084_c0_g1_i1.p1 TRINITY_DN4084_c0_g1~~TRINITY_DN4084_c0_g1_i1.p1  ORF type:complete len:390 (+),score=66.87 TRINITY_DN4084_c0_g1_i1:34-1203(+)